jgi:DNA (cytosine-5)-methyltransferase 1
MKTISFKTLSPHIRPIAIDLFCGAGGMSLGFEQAGFDVISAVDVDPVHAAVHSFNFPLCNTICDDISNISGNIISKGNQVDVVIGGPPCQGFSMIGKRDINDPRNDMLHQFVRMVNEIRPRYFVMENVAGLTIGKTKNILENVIFNFKKIGYNVLNPYMILDSKYYGVPQSRKRLFIIGYKFGHVAPFYPPPKHLAVSVSDAISDLPNIDEFKELELSDSLSYKIYPNSHYAKLLHGDIIDSTDFSYQRIWNRDILTGCLRTNHTIISVNRFKNTLPGMVEPISRFLKLDFNGLCNTLRAGTDKSKGAFTSPRPIHPRDNRCISVREAQRLHSYPDWFRMHCTKWHGFREVGNSVPPLLARSVASQIIHTLGVKPQKPKQCIELGSKELLEMTVTRARSYFEELQHIESSKLVAR